jgi:hypothetical protein
MATRGEASRRVRSEAKPGICIPANPAKGLAREERRAREAIAHKLGFTLSQIGSITPKPPGAGRFLVTVPSRLMGSLDEMFNDSRRGDDLSVSEFIGLIVERAIVEYRSRR